MQISVARFALVVGSISALGPMSIDLYLPGLQTISHQLQGAPGEAELTLTGYYVGYTVGQMIYGPLSDRWGRRGPILIGLSLFILGSLAASVVPSLPLLIIARLIQGLGSAAPQVISPALIRDMYVGPEAARLQATRMLVVAVSPILAPTVGAAIIAFGSWRWVFWISTALGVLGLLLVVYLLPETRSEEARRGTSLVASFSTLPRLATDWTFFRLTLISGFTQGLLLAYIAGSSFVYISMNNTPPAVYGILFGINGAGVILLAQFTPQLMRRFGAEAMIRYGTRVLTVGSCLFLLAAATGCAVVAIMAPLLFVTIVTLGVVLGPTTILALREQGRSAGAASSFIGFMQGSIGASGTALVSVLANGTALPMAATMTIFAGVACMLAIGVSAPPIPSTTKAS